MFGALSPDVVPERADALNDALGVDGDWHGLMNAQSKFLPQAPSQGTKRRGIFAPRASNEIAKSPSSSHSKR